MLVSVYLEIVLILTQDWCPVCTERTISSKIILDTPDKSNMVTWVMWYLISVRLETVLVSIQARCTFCDKYTTGQEDAHFGPFGDNANLDAR
jgi:hypothetical protein